MAEVSSEVPKKILVCGGGNGSHVFAVLSSKLISGTEVYWLSLYADEAERITKNLEDSPIIASDESETLKIEGRPKLATKDPALAKIDECDVILICVPAFAHGQYLDVICKYKPKKGCIFGVFPSGCGFELEYLAKIKHYGLNASDYILINCLTLPWACRIKPPFAENYGRCVQVLGTKGKIDNVGSGSAELVTAAIKTLQKYCIGTAPRLECDPSSHIIKATLGSVNATRHPPILYCHWKDWDGQPVEEKPLFYHGITRECAAFIIAMVDEAGAIGKAFTAKLETAGIPEKIELLPVEEWDRFSYKDTIADNTDCYTNITTNSAYAGLTHPMKEVSDESGAKKYIPDWSNRYLTEDVPQGLVPIKGFALLLDVPVPCIDKVLLWAQKVMGKSYLNVETGQLDGPDVKSARAPQSYGFTDIDEIIKAFAPA